MHQTHHHKEGSVRHAEKRRISTCPFADRIAKISIDTYNSQIPIGWAEGNQRICLASIVAHFKDRDVKNNLQVLAFGVGTKFLSEKDLRLEINSSVQYGQIIRDSHAEVLARRAFQRQLLCEMNYHLSDKDFGFTDKDNMCILRMEKYPDGIISFASKDNVTIHMYTSSAPCGNSTLKKFTKMTKEAFQSGLDENCFSLPPHEPIPLHSLHLGQCSLLVKKRNSDDTVLEYDFSRLNKKMKIWPANLNDDWCPPGTSLPHMRKGSIHTCSDKIARWNCLGLQGSLLSAILSKPIYMDSITIGRKFNRCVSQRALCCRALGFETRNEDTKSIYSLHHPSIMCTSVYLDDSGVIEMNGKKVVGQDIRFPSKLCWSWWPMEGKSECIDGESGSLYSYDVVMSKLCPPPKTCTNSLTNAFLNIWEVTGHEKLSCPSSITELRAIKERVSQSYESAKLDLLKHNTFSLWNRRWCDF